MDALCSNDCWFKGGEEDSRDGSYNLLLSLLPLLVSDSNGLKAPDVPADRDLSSFRCCSYIIHPNIHFQINIQTVLAGWGLQLSYEPSLFYINEVLLGCSQTNLIQGLLLPVITSLYNLVQLCHKSKAGRRRRRRRRNKSEAFTIWPFIKTINWLLHYIKITLSKRMPRKQAIINFKS